MYSSDSQQEVLVAFGTISSAPLSHQPFEPDNSLRQEDYPVYHRMFSNTAGFCPLDAARSSSFHSPNDVSRDYQMFAGRQNRLIANH